MLDRGLSTQEVMDRLGVKDPDTVYAAYRAGKISGNKLGRVWRFSEKSVDAFLAGMAVTTASEPSKSREHHRPPMKIGPWRHGVKQIIKR